MFYSGKPGFVMNRDGNRFVSDNEGVLEAPGKYKDTLKAYGFDPVEKSKKEEKEEKETETKEKEEVKKEKDAETKKD